MDLCREDWRYNIPFLPLPSLVADFSNKTIAVVVPARSRTFTVPEFFTIVDDDIDKDGQSFTIVAEIGPDVPENVSCFQLGYGQRECLG